MHYPTKGRICFIILGMDYWLEPEITGHLTNALPLRFFQNYIQMQNNPRRTNGSIHRLLHTIRVGAVGSNQTTDIYRSKM